MPKVPEPVHSGQRARASDRNQQISYARQMQLIVVWPLRLIGGSSNLKLVYDGPVEFWAAITEKGSGGTAGQFGWVEVTPRANGTWTNLKRHGDLAVYPAWEVNHAETADVGDVVWMRIGPGTKEPRFQLEKCGPGDGGGGGGGEEPTGGRTGSPMGFFMGS